MKTTILFTIIIFTTYCGNTENNTEPNEPDSKSVIPQSEYTKENPEEWKDISLDHIPNISWEKKADEFNFTIETTGKTYHSGHRIEKIEIMDRDKMDLVVENLKQDQALTKISLKIKNGNWLENSKIFVKCNLHDLWTVPIEGIINVKK